MACVIHPFVDHACGSKFPTATILYFAQIKFLSVSLLIVEISILGRSMSVIGQRILYSFPEINSQNPVSSVDPRYLFK